MSQTHDAAVLIRYAESCKTKEHTLVFFKIYNLFKNKHFPSRNIDELVKSANIHDIRLAMAKNEAFTWHFIKTDAFFKNSNRNAPKSSITKANFEN